MSKRRSKRKKGYYPKKRRSDRPRTSKGGVQLTTPEGDDIVFTSAHYRHAAQEEISALLQQADDFDLEDVDGDPLNFIWLETRPKAAQFAPLDRRLLAHLTLTASKLEVEAFSHRRLTNCRQRLAQLVGDHIQLVDIQVKDMDEALRESSPAEPVEPYIPPPEVVAELEEKMLRQWLEESIPALDGKTPREAMKTAEGRQQLLELFDYIERMQKNVPSAPGMFSPDYRKAKKMLGLE